MTKTKLDAKNSSKAINTWAVPVLRSSSGIVNWKKDEREELDRGTSKMLAAERAFTMSRDVNRLYLPRKEGGKGLMNIEGTNNKVWRRTLARSETVLSELRMN